MELISSSTKELNSIFCFGSHEPTHGTYQFLNKRIQLNFLFWISRTNSWNLSVPQQKNSTQFSVLDLTNQLMELISSSTKELNSIFCFGSHEPTHGTYQFLNKRTKLNFLFWISRTNSWNLSVPQQKNSTQFSVLDLTNQLMELISSSTKEFNSIFCFLFIHTTLSFNIFSTLS